MWSFIRSATRKINFGALSCFCPQAPAGDKVAPVPWLGRTLSGSSPVLRPWLRSNRRHLRLQCCYFRNFWWCLLERSRSRRPGAGPPRSACPWHRRWQQHQRIPDRLTRLRWCTPTWSWDEPTRTRKEEDGRGASVAAAVPQAADGAQLHSSFLDDGEGLAVSIGVPECTLFGACAVGTAYSRFWRAVTAQTSAVAASHWDFGLLRK